ncbi:helix-turn-helix domain-containing protein [Candidatus Poriferisodalis sp.]|uniref:helix-turn-helix domain-containing protein n=1 Tax=Candidatus Poriferisodalis sp. TaxID=3101277 RepID=UPI003C6F46DD
MNVNNNIEWHLGAELEAEVFRILRAIPEFSVTVEQGHIHHADAVVRHGGSATPIAIQVKTRVSSAAAHHIAHQARQLSIPTVVIAREMTDRAREILGTEDIGSIDGLGNIRLNLPGLIMRITGEPRPKRAPPPTRLSGKSSLVVQAMLLEAKRPWRVTDLAKRAGVSVGLAHRVLQRLDGEGVVEFDGAGPTKTRRLANPAALLDLWAEEHRDRPLRRPAFLLTPTDRNLADALCDGLETTAIDYALTGAAAVARIAPLVTNVAVAEVWLEATADPSAVCEDLGALEVASGPNVVFLQEPGDAPLAFRTRDNGVWTTNRFRLFLDLRRDPKRGREQADYLRRELIGF